MVPFLGRPLIFRQLDTFRLAGIYDITIVGGYHAECLKLPNVKVVHNNRFAETNMVYTLFCAESCMKSGEDLIISYGDIVFEPKVLTALLQYDAPMSIIIDRSWRKLWSERMDDPLSDAETLKLKDGNRIIELGKKTNSYDDIQGQYIGLIKVAANRIEAFIQAWHSLDKKILYDGKNFENMYMTSFLQHLIDTGWDVRAALIDNGWLEVDTVEDLDHYERLEAEGRLKMIYDLQNE